MKSILSESGYILDGQRSVWTRADYSGIDYSDGAEVEQRILETVRATNDLDSISPELVSKITDWPTRYHFSPLRSNLLRPFGHLFIAGRRIFEIGAGCGAISRFLGECGGDIVALEGSPIRAATAAARCRDLPNVCVVAEAFDKFPLQPLFDVVTLIGVLEYARKYFPAQSGDPVDALLCHARKFLKPDGVLIVAIENQLGLKYFAGAAEDHVGTSMYGIEDRYNDTGVVTFGKQELSARLERAGLTAQDWWFPFPDYKLPTAVVSEEGLKGTIGQQLDALLSSTFEADAQLPRHPTFFLDRAWKPIVRNGLGADLANSFLVFAGRQAAVNEAHKNVAYHFSVFRKPEFAKSITFTADAGNKLTITQAPVFPECKVDSAIPLCIHHGDKSPFVEGKLWLQELKTILTTDGWTQSQLTAWAKRWFTALLEHANIQGVDTPLPPGYSLPGSLIDAIPRNLVVTPDGKSVFIDQEYSLQLPIELGFMIFRGIYLSLLSVGKVAPPSIGTPIHGVTLFRNIAQSLGLWITEADFSRYCAFEVDFQTWVVGRSYMNLENFLAFSFDVRPPLGRNTELQTQNTELQTQNTELQTQNTELQTQNTELQTQINVRDAQISGLLRSRSWRATAWLRWLGAQARRARNVLLSYGVGPAAHVRRIRQSSLFDPDFYAAENPDVVAARVDLAKHYAIFGWKEYRNPSAGFSTRSYLEANPDVAAAGINPLLHYIECGQAEGRRIHSEKEALAQRYAAYGTQSFPSEKRILQERSEIAALGEAAALPRFSILTPLYNTPEPFLREMIESVLAQTYENWELCLADGSDNAHSYVERVVREYMARDNHSRPRIVYKRLAENKGISENTNACLAMAGGDYIGLLDHDDILHPEALHLYAKEILERGADFIYSDECSFDETINDCFNIHHKPDFSPDYLRSCNYICHLTVFSRKLHEQTGGFRKEFDGSQDYDIVLRLTEKAQCIRHIPKVLYYWRSHAQSTALNIHAKYYAIDAAKRALAEHLQRVGLNGTIEDVAALGFYRIKYEIEGEPLVSIIIPNKDNIDLLKRCIDSILRRSSYQNFEIIIVENNSEKQSTFQYYESLAGERIMVVRWGGEFNFSAITNFGATFAKGKYILLLNNDTEVIAPDWMQEMLMFAQRKDVGAVGAKLYYPDDTVQHAGVILGIGGVAGHSHKHYSKESHGYFARLVVAQNLSAVTAACMIVPKKVFDEVGGLNEAYAVAFNDVDLCMKIRKAGYLIVYTPYAELYHYESISRGYEDTPEKVERFSGETKLFMDLWGDELAAGDPYYNPNLSLDYEDFRSKDATCKIV